MLLPTQANAEILSLERKIWLRLYAQEWIKHITLQQVLLQDLLKEQVNSFL